MQSELLGRWYLLLDKLDHCKKPFSHNSINPPILSYSILAVPNQCISLTEILISQSGQWFEDVDTHPLEARLVKIYKLILKCDLRVLNEKHCSWKASLVIHRATKLTMRNLLSI